MPTLKVNGIRMYYEIKGSGEPIVFISGIGSDHTCWDASIETLSQRYTCLSFDNRGMGKSDKPDIPYTSALMAEDTAQLMDKVGIPNAHIVGTSMGGVIAQELAIAHPEKVKSLVLISTWAKADPLLTKTFELPISFAESGKIAEAWDSMVIWSFTPEFYNGTPEMQHVGDTIASGGEVSAHALIRQARVILSHDTVSRLGQITSPTLILVGAEDILTPCRFARQLHEGIPGSQLRVLNGCAHAFPINQSEIFINALVQFLDRAKDKEV